ncbi:protoheme IX farnesyltransferase [Candidatus Saccharibacteria bacterium]|nr:protoheme IX farnesyltransferase [Candidatus Saccharibacteria bacterium]
MKETIKLYYKLAKPGIIYGNLMSAIAGFMLASQRNFDPDLFLAMIAGTAMVIGSGCVFNNYIDRGIDSKMKRTERRALPAGRIPLVNALIYGTVLGLSGFGILWHFTNPVTVLLGFIGIFFYVVVYGIAKRRTPWGTVIGSIPGATPAAAGYTAFTGTFDEAALLLFLILTVWQMPHFYALAIFQLDDYKRAGLPVLSAVRGIRTTKTRIMAYIAASIPLAPLLTVFGYTGYTFALVMSILGIVWFWEGIKKFNATDSVAWARRMFVYSLIVLLVFPLAVTVDIFLP